MFKAPLKKKHLPKQDRIVASFVLSIFLFAIFIKLSTALLPSLPMDEPIEIALQTVEVTIQGAVKKPGMYQVKKGTELRELMALAEPLDVADLRRFKMDRKLVRRSTIMIREAKPKRNADKNEKCEKNR